MSNELIQTKEELNRQAISNGYKPVSNAEYERYIAYMSNETRE